MCPLVGGRPEHLSLAGPCLGSCLCGLKGDEIAPLTLTAQGQALIRCLWKASNFLSRRPTHCKPQQRWKAQQLLCPQFLTKP